VSGQLGATHPGHKAVALWFAMHEVSVTFV
jgi:hypothetical protein